MAKTETTSIQLALVLHNVLGSALACKTELMHFEVSEVGNFICLVSKKPV